MADYKKTASFNLNIFDYLIILLNIAAARGNYLPFWLFHTSKSIYVTAIIAGIDVLYIFLRLGLRVRGMRNRYNAPIYFALILLFYNSFNVFLHGGNYIPYLEYAVVILLFSVILGSLLHLLEPNPLSLREKVRQISKGYVWISMFSVLGVFLSFTLFLAGFSSFVPIEADFLDANIDSGTLYYRSFLSINSSNALVRVPFFHNYGILSGLFHEPHIFAYNAIPCIFLVFGLKEKNKRLINVLLIIMTFLVVLFAGSTTNILALLATLLVLAFSRLRSHFFEVLLGAALLVILVYYYISQDNTLYELVLGRMASDNFSQQYSVSLLEYAFTPKTLFGTDFLTTTYVTATSFTQDVGIIPFLLNIMFLFFYLRNVFLLLRKNDNLSLFIALSSLYFILHSLKIGMTMYIQTPYVLLIFLQSFILNSYGRVKAS